MGRKNRDSLLDYSKQVCKYRWEFLRRNKIYIKDYLIKFKNKSKNKARKWIRLGLNWEEMKYWDKKFGIGYPLNPDISYKELGNNKYYLDKYPAILFDSILYKNINSDSAAINLDYLIYLNDIGKEPLSKIKGIKIYVNLFKKRKEIIKEFTSFIDNWRRLIQKEQREINNRARFEQYARYLKVYDLRNHNWSWDKLANKFYKNDSGGLNYARRKVKRDYDKCKKLIDSGYRQIR